MRCIIVAIFSLLSGFAASAATAESSLRIATFQVDATPPLGSPLCNGNVTPAMQIVSPLTARGVILLTADKPIVLCAVDWVGIGNESYDAFRAAIAKATGTTADRVALHTLHQHDAPGSDLATERLLTGQGLAKQFSNPDLDAQVMQRLAGATREALSKGQKVTHLGFGSAKVEKVASNRRILGSDGRVAIQRQSSGGRSPKAAAAPEGVIDPLVRLVSFWQGDRALGVLTYYATHPQSYYGKGGVNWDFVGIARETREKALPGLPHIHFNGAGGNVAAGKYNDGKKDKRPLLAGRLADGMQRAWESQKKTPVTAADVGWRVQRVSLPVRKTLVEAELAKKLTDESATKRVRMRAARDLVFVRRMNNGHGIPVSCLKLGAARILHMPGELFVEYQLAAQQMRPAEFVAMAAYGDYGPGYIGTKIAYSQGGYETGIVSRVAPTVEKVLTDAMRELLEVKSSRNDAKPWKRHTIDPSDRTAGKRGADGVRLADVNGDGRLDIATGWEEGGAVVAYLNPGPDKAKNAWPSVTVGSVRGVEDAVFVDLDADGAVDVVSCAEGKVNNVFVHWAPKSKAKYLTPNAWKTEAFPATEGRRWMFAVPLDMNQDGRIDLVIGSKNTNAIVGWLENPKDARDTTKWKLHQLCPASWIMSLRVSDLDGDGDKDIVFSDRFGSEPGIFWLENPGRQQANWKRRLIGGKGHQVMFLSLGDLHGKNARNVICPTLGGDLLYCKRDKNGSWNESLIPLPFGLKAGKAVEIADVNLDGRPDIVTTSEAQREADDMVAVAWKENTSSGWVDHAISDKHGRKFDRVEMLDLDGDGDLDLLTCEEVHNLGVFWYENPTR